MFMKKQMILFLLLFILVSCNKTIDQETGKEISIIETLANTNGKKIKVKIITGKAWESSLKIMGFSKTITPQIAVWSEDQKGNYVETLYVTYKFAKQDWHGASDQKENETFRIESIPYWMHKYISSGKKSPTKNTPLADTITTASPDKDFILKTKLNSVKNKINILVELNNSYDNNDNYKEMQGQPSVVYSSTVNINEPGKYKMKLLGFSDVSGKSGKLIKNIKKVTSAYYIIEKAYIIIE